MSKLPTMVCVPATVNMEVASLGLGKRPHNAKGLDDATNSAVPS